MRRLISSCLGLLLTISTTAFAQHDPTLAFAAMTNPSGMWTYGWKAASNPFGAFTQAPVLASGAYSARWSDGSMFGGVYYNDDDNDMSNGGGTISMHPFANGELAVLRFTAPNSGLFSFAGFFVNGDAATADVYVTLNNATHLTQGLITSSVTQINFNHTLTLLAGETVDFAEGFGANRSYAFDTVHLDLNQTAVVTTPEPAGMILIATGLFGILAVRRRRPVLL